MLVEQVRIEARDHYVAKLPDETKDSTKPLNVTRLDVVLKSDPFDLQERRNAESDQDLADDGTAVIDFIHCDVQAECFGITANSCDLAELTESDRAARQSAGAGGDFRHPAAAGAAAVAGGLSAGHGAGQLLRRPRGHGRWSAISGRGSILPSLDWRVPFFLFTILVAVGEDYNILLVHRAMQEQRRFGLVEGMRRALAKTGGAITSCGLIMAGTFATLMLAGLGTLLQIGFALAFGVLVDTFLVRPFLVPAFAILLEGRGPGTAQARPDTAAAPVLVPMPGPIPEKETNTPEPQPGTGDNVLADLPQAA